jgi:hypothetical protein
VLWPVIEHWIYWTQSVGIVDAISTINDVNKRNKENYTSSILLIHQWRHCEVSRTRILIFRVHWTYKHQKTIEYNRTPKCTFENGYADSLVWPCAACVNAYLAASWFFVSLKSKAIAWPTSIRCEPCWLV